MSYKDADKNGTITQSEIVQEKNYYPFGLTHKGYNDNTRGRNHNYGFNGIELTENLGLNLYEMDLRKYDPTIARWTGIDPLTFHSQSTYNGMDNNPVFWADPSGAAVEQIKGGVSYTGEHAALALGALKKQYGGGNSGGSGEEVTQLPEVTVTLRKGDIGGNILSRNRAARRTEQNIYATKWYDRNYGGDGSGSFKDNSIYAMDKINQYNPLALLTDNVYQGLYGTDRLGNPMTTTQANLNTLSIIPIGRVGSSTASSLWKVGPYNKIRGSVIGLDAHHVGQAALMERMIPNYNRRTAPSILVPKVGHTIKGPNGIVSRSTRGLTTPRQVLARDIFELRRVYPNIPNYALQALISLNKKKYGTSFLK